MTLSSGSIPYDYDYGHGAFHAPNPYLSDYPIGPSGVLLEQAQFVITAELRKWKKFDGIEGSHTLPIFDVFVNPSIAPSGPYEPKTDGSTLGNAFYPGAIFIDNIDEIRVALDEIFFNTIGADANDDYKTAWLSALYPNNASGAMGEYSRRFPSEVGPLDYTAIDVLGGSGVLFDIDFGELMYNPFPHISLYREDNAHRSNDIFDIQQSPIFPAFQKTDGTLIPLTGREPSILDNNFHNYILDPIGSGKVMINGYCLQNGTNYYINRGGYIFDVSVSPAFSHFASSARNTGDGGNIPTTRAYVTPTAQGSGLYRILSINKRINFPNTTIESGTVSSWPELSRYPRNGYHVFDDSLWMTDRSNVSITTSNTTTRGKPSGLALLSPYNMDRLWVRYADQTKFNSTSAGIVTYRSWASGTALIRSSPNNIYRFHSDVQRPTTTSSGQFRLARYNDKLDFLTDVTTTSDALSVLGGLANQFPLGGSVDAISDAWYDETAQEYWVSNLNNAGFDLWKFDNSLNYINKYIFNPPSGLFDMRGVFVGGQQFLFYGTFGALGQNINSSGIYPVHIGAEGTEPYDNSATEPKIGVAYIWPEEAKFINGAPFIGHQIDAEIMDMLEVTASSHLIPGVYALVRWTPSVLSGGTLYMLRLEETATSWEIRAITQIQSTLVLSPVRREMLYMSY